MIQQQQRWKKMYNEKYNEREEEKIVHLGLRGMKNIFQSTTTQRFHGKTIQHYVEAEKQKSK